MEEESFQDEGVAKLMNENYISIKVDREERPDVDIVYQTALELIQNTGGWPLNAILLPDGKPVYLGTYHDKENWKSVIRKFSEEYKTNPDKMAEYAQLLTGGIQEVYEGTMDTTHELPNRSAISNAVVKWSTSWDLEWGGDQAMEKFVNPSRLNLLMDYAFLSQDAATKGHLKKTLDIIKDSGIHDHVGGGFFRYTIDEKWKIPHFEKMLYDNAQMLGLYARAYRAFKNPEYLKVVQSTADFLNREMKGSEGGYISALDADGPSGEGAFYVWTKDELQSILKDEFEIFSELYSINTASVWENGGYILNKTGNHTKVLKAFNMTSTDLEKRVRAWNQALLKERAKRKVPKQDDKIISSWNALLISGLVEAYTATKEPLYLKRAQKVFQFLLDNNMKKEGLVHSHKPGSRQTEVFLEDYAFMAKSALDSTKSVWTKRTSLWPNLGPTMC